MGNLSILKAKNILNERLTMCQHRGLALDQSSNWRNYSILNGKIMTSCTRWRLAPQGFSSKKNGLLEAEMSKKSLEYGTLPCLPDLAKCYHLDNGPALNLQVISTELLQKHRVTYLCLQDAHMLSRCDDNALSHRSATIKGEMIRKSLYIRRNYSPTGRCFAPQGLDFRFVVVKSEVFFEVFDSENIISEQLTMFPYRRLAMKGLDFRIFELNSEEKLSIVEAKSISKE